MSAGRLAKFTGHVKKWQERLGVQEFDITVTSERLDSGTSAETRRNTRYKRARIVLNSHNKPDRSTRTSDEDLYRTAAHEVLHVATAELSHRSLDHLSRVLGEGTLYETAKDEIIEAEERLCDRLAVNLVRWERSK